MTDLPLTTSSGDPERKPLGRLLTLVTLFAAGLAGTAAFIENVDKIGGGFHDGCRYLGMCAPEAAKPPVLPAYTSPRMGGGHNPTEQCEPTRQSYAQQNPKFNITMQTSESSDKDTFGHVTYVYHCSYAAVPE